MLMWGHRELARVSKLFGEPLKAIPPVGVVASTSSSPLSILYKPPLIKLLDVGPFELFIIVFLFPLLNLVLRSLFE